MRTIQLTCNGVTIDLTGNFTYSSQFVKIPFAYSANTFMNGEITAEWISPLVTKCQLVIDNVSEINKRVLDQFITDECCFQENDFSINPASDVDVGLGAGAEVHEAYLSVESTDKMFKPEAPGTYQVNLAYEFVESKTAYKLTITPASGAPLVLNFNRYFQAWYGWSLWSISIKELGNLQETQLKHFLSSHSGEAFTFTPSENLNIGHGEGVAISSVRLLIFDFDNIATLYYYSGNNGNALIRGLTDELLPVGSQQFLNHADYVKFNMVQKHHKVSISTYLSILKNKNIDVLPEVSAGVLQNFVMKDYLIEDNAANPLYFHLTLFKDGTVDPTDIKITLYCGTVSVEIYVKRFAFSGSGANKWELALECDSMNRSKYESFVRDICSYGVYEFTVVPQSDYDIGFGVGVASIPVRHWNYTYAKDQYDNIYLYSSAVSKGCCLLREENDNPGLTLNQIIFYKVLDVFSSTTTQLQFYFNTEPEKSILKNKMDNLIGKPIRMEPIYDSSLWYRGWSFSNYTYPVTLKFKNVSLADENIPLYLSYNVEKDY